MTALFESVLQKVEAQCRRRGVPMLGREKAAFLAEQIEQAKPRLVVECGTAIGYSGLWIASRLRQWGGRLITHEINADSAEEAQGNFARGGVGDLITLRVGDARQSLQQITEEVDFLFLDNGYGNYLPCFQALEPRLRDGAILLADNVGIGEAQMRPYLDHVRARFASQTVWFDTPSLPWVERDAMEVTVFRRSG